MSNAQIERRLKALEAEMERLKAALQNGSSTPKKGWRSIVGSFAGDPLHAQAMKLGRKYRESLRPKTKRR